MAETKPFLVEIGTEELPPKMLRQLANYFYEGIWRALDTHRFIPNSYRLKGGDFFYSPRRLAVYIPYVLTKQPALDVALVAGPALNIAFDENKNPTKAAEGFARKFNVSIDKLIQKDERLYFKPKPHRMEAKLYLPSTVMGSLERLPIPKQMRWGLGEAVFVRPVHWVVMMLGDQALDAEIMGTKVSNKTYGHRFHHPSAITINRPADYRKVLEKTGKVLVEDRQGSLAKKIGTLVNQAAKRVHGKAQTDQSLLEEVAALVEWPVPVTGSFDKKFLALPEDVIVAVLETQQRYFSLRDTKGNLLAKFIAVSNIQSKQPAEVRRGNERVIVPRLSDAVFFWNEDCKRALESRIPELDRMLFQEELGSYGDKRKRIAMLTQAIAHQINGDAHSAQRAAELAKCDLLTNLVGEFPELQGVVGGHLARHQNEPKEVAQAIREQYLPRFANDSLPKSKTGQALAIADKLDTVCGIFNTGEKPTGDKDPFALRRLMLGALRIAIECELNLDFVKLIDTALGQFPKQRDNVKLEIFGFLTERLRAYCEERDIDPNVFYAAEATENGNPYDFKLRLNATQTFINQPEAINLISANKRIANILRKENINIQMVGAINPDLLKDSTEIALYNAVIKQELKILPMIQKRDYTSALLSLATLRPIVDEFFDKVKVMAEEPMISKNRIALVAKVRHLFLEICDLSLVQVNQ